MVFRAGNWPIYGRVKRARMEKNGAIKCMLDRTSNEIVAGGKLIVWGEKEWRVRREEKEREYEDAVKCGNWEVWR